MDDHEEIEQALQREQIELCRLIKAERCWGIAVSVCGILMMLGLAAAAWWAYR